ncbi:glucosaminidase domain-containing protein [Leptolyngbya sp. FACHB-541]|uniref:hormogonium tapered terminus morphoprotein TftA n=1 Tax=Leptolyngbya sp. FACHB-541 TaxID=2692810 RepID=UPI0016864358|nr:N-acetylmuramoyl-L-alanine amidase [Leptolyngbya sp. FACHB-541]MBD1996250.1 glucosaminidase domain-containing protein [Leptolyngbya sp. FACHB-541]
MGRIFLYANQSAAIDETAEAALVRIRDRVVDLLRSRGFTVFTVPPLELSGAIAWINRRARPGDVALAIQTDAFGNPAARGASIFYIADNQERQEQAQLVLLSLLQEIPNLVSRGAIPDSATGLGRLEFIRQVTIPSLVLNIGFFTNPTERSLIQNRTQDIAQGIANGLTVWSQEVSGVTPVPPTYPPINISINNQAYEDRGIIVEGNAYVPVDVVERLDIDLTQPATVRLIDYGGVAYIRAIDLREAGVFVGWDASTRTVILRTVQPLTPSEIGKINGSGSLSEAQLENFLRSVNPQALEQYPDIAELYIQEAAIEGINSDIAFAQALLETGFFSFVGGLEATQNNFGGLGTVGGSGETASFPSARLGVRAHIQHLKAYANEEPVVQEIVDPRFRFVRRGASSRVELLSGRWSADPQYGEKVLAILRRLYQSAGLL